MCRPCVRNPQMPTMQDMSRAKDEGMVMSSWSRTILKVVVVAATL